MKDELEKLKLRIEKLEQRRVYTTDIMPKAVTQAAIDGLIIFRGLAADRPTDGSTEKQAYFAEDTKVFSIWNTTSEAWESETLS